MGESSRRLVNCLMNTDNISILIQALLFCAEIYGFLVHLVDLWWEFCVLRSIRLLAKLLVLHGPSE